MRNPTFIVIDYHRGNLLSVERALLRAGADEVQLSDDPDSIVQADGLVLPGVGSFFDAITYMRAQGQDSAIHQAVAAGVPLLGICLGMQLLYERGCEGVDEAEACSPSFDKPDATSAHSSGISVRPGGTPARSGGTRAQDAWTPGLGILKGSCERLPAGRLKVPHVGWDQVYPTTAGRACPLMVQVPDGANFYYTHSYVVRNTDPSECAALTHYLETFTTVGWHGRTFGCQFHPEKSSIVGLHVLRNFVAFVRRLSHDCFSCTRSYRGPCCTS